MTRVPDNFIIITLAWILGIFPGMNMANPDILESQVSELKQKFLFEKDYPQCRNAGKLDKSRAHELKKDLLSTEFKVPLWKYFCLNNLPEITQAESKTYQVKIESELAGNIVRTWLLALSYRQNSQFENFNKYIHRAHKMMLSRGQMISPELASIFFKSADADIQNKLFRHAEKNLKIADLFDSHSNLVPLMHIKIATSEKKLWNWNIAGIWTQVKKIKSRLRIYDNFHITLFNLLQTARTCLSVFFGVCLLVYVLKYFSKAVHSLVEKIQVKVQVFWKVILTGSIFICLPLLGLGLLSSAFLLTLFLWKFLSPREKKITMGFFTALFVLPLILMLESRLYNHKYPGSAEYQYRKAALELPSETLKKKLQDFTPENGNERLLNSVSQSILFKKLGEMEKASNLAFAALEENPTSAVALNNLGNIFFLQNDYKAARAYYQKALIQLPKSSEIHFNLSQIELFSNNSYEHAVLLEKAMNYNPELANFVTQNDKFIPENLHKDLKASTSWPPLRKFMDLQLQSSDGILGENKFAGDNIQIQLAGLEISPMFYPALLIILLILGYMNRGSELSFLYGKAVFICKICGKTICSVCRLGPHCESCHNIIKGIEENAVKKDLTLEIRKDMESKRQKAAHVLNFFFPGSGNFYLGDTLSLFGPFLIVSICWGVFLSIDNFIMDYPNYISGMVYVLMFIPLCIIYTYHWLILIMNFFQSRTSSEGKI